MADTGALGHIVWPPMGLALWSIFGVQIETGSEAGKHSEGWKEKLQKHLLDENRMEHT